MNAKDVGAEYASRVRLKEQAEAQALSLRQQLFKRVMAEVVEALSSAISSFNSGRRDGEAKLKISSQDTFILIGGILPGAMIVFEKDTVEIAPNAGGTEKVMSYDVFRYSDQKGKLSFQNVFFGNVLLYGVDDLVHLVFERMLD